VTIEVERYLAVGAALFVLGALGFLTRRDYRQTATGPLKNHVDAAALLCIC
jgi:hypothetical protein